MPTPWTFLTTHASVLLCVFRREVSGEPPPRVREIAASVGVTERTVQHILGDLEESGYLVRNRVGNRTHYEVRASLPVRDATDDAVEVRDLLGTFIDARAPASDVIKQGLHAMREHLDMDVAFVSRLHSGRREFAYVDTASGTGPIFAGDSDPAEDSYCQQVVDGRIPQLLIDPGQHPVAASLSATTELPVGTHLSVPIDLPGGDHGTCCAFTYDVQPHRDERDLAAVRMLARLVVTSLDESRPVTAKSTTA